MPRLGWPYADRWSALDLGKKQLDFLHNAYKRWPPKHGTDVIGSNLDGAVALMRKPARCASRNDPIASGPECQRWDRRLAVVPFERGFVDVVTGNSLVKLANIRVSLVIARKR